MYTIYLITNTVNGMQYVGQTTLTPEERFMAHVYGRRSQRYRNKIGKAITKYGTDAFEVKAIGYADTLEEATRIEAQKIIELNTLEPNGYNLTTSTIGEGRRETSAETSARLSEASKRRWAKVPQEERRHAADKMNAVLAERGRGPMHPNTRAALLKANLGSKRSDETRKKMSDGQKAYWDRWHAEHPARPKIVSDKRVPVRCVETGECFESTKQAAEAKGIKKPHNIGECLTGKRKSAGGFHWEALPHEQFRESEKQVVRDAKHHEAVRKV